MDTGQKKGTTQNKLIDFFMILLLLVAIGIIVIIL